MADDLDKTIAHLFAQRMRAEREMKNYDRSIEILLNDRVEQFGPMAEPWPFQDHALAAACRAVATQI